MTLLPTLRQKKRYILFEIKAFIHFSALDVKDEVDKALLLFLGQLGVARSSPMFLTEAFNVEKQQFILKVNHKYVNEAKAALILIKKIKNTPVFLRSVSVSGSIKKVKEKQ